jgi:hypothetical protein
MYRKISSMSTTTTAAPTTVTFKTGSSQGCGSPTVLKVELNSANACPVDSPGGTVKGASWSGSYCTDAQNEFVTTPDGTYVQSTPILGCGVAYTLPAPAPTQDTTRYCAFGSIAGPGATVTLADGTTLQSAANGPPNTYEVAHGQALTVDFDNYSNQPQITCYDVSQ